ncbi:MULTISPECIES: GNAT family N-acetyltransferase [Rhodoplanes]|uniref:Uncharacterized protein n=1 Tax=Rhodoplanes serenus TaxID=200615 RepID=A0A327KE28_9BRAD|nr:GNAT family N-acetyltransferase [Rhodoplanes serenus]RAI35805.1 hypothetical protein CH340_04980 [Rhodoplanes serenus]VCU09362.1 hypothetical protein RHODGE_RHODGE_02534 [Rhodoplanes serenus]
MTARHPRLLWLPLAPFERDGARAALKRAGLPHDDVDAPGRWYWRFEEDDVPVGFGGVEVHGDAGLLRIVTLPVLRHRGLGAAIATALEGETAALGCRILYVAPGGEVAFFTEQGYAPCPAGTVPDAIAARLPAPDGVMHKRVG